MVYYQPFPMYRQGQQNINANGTSPQHMQAQAQAHQQVAAQMHQQVAAQVQAQAHQHAAAAAVAVVDGNVAQQYWYQHAYPGVTALHHHHHQPTTPQHQYLENPLQHTPEGMLPWPPHPHPHPHPYAHHPYAHQAAYHHQQQQQQQQQQSQMSVSEWSGSSDEGNANQNRRNQRSVRTSEPSPTITVSSSEISSPATPSTLPEDNVNANVTVSTTSESMNPMRPSQVRSPFGWITKPSYQNQPHPGKTRTKDKYRVVYNEHQRLELEKEFHYSRYITIRRKAELAANLSLSERQVKIWFQNRRAKERKQSKKIREEMMHKQVHGKVSEIPVTSSMASLSIGGMNNMLNALLPVGPQSATMNIPGPSSAVVTYAPPTPSVHSQVHQHPHPSHFS